MTIGLGIAWPISIPPWRFPRRHECLHQSAPTLGSLVEDRRLIVVVVGQHPWLWYLGNGRGNVPNGLFAKGDTIARRLQQKGLARVAWLLQRIQQPLLHLVGGFGDNLTRKQDSHTPITCRWKLWRLLKRRQSLGDNKMGNRRCDDDDRPVVLVRLDVCVFQYPFI